MNNRMVPDKKDLKILNVLQRDSRSSLRQIAREVGISPATVQTRLKRLEDAGIIKKYTIEIDYDKLGYAFPVLIDVRVSEGKLFEVEREIAKNPHVLAVYDVTGEFDVTVLAKFKSRKELDAFVKSLQKMKYVERTFTRLILNIILERTNIGQIS
ncbi:AsnC family transcriptional regulator [Candidatus Geothermarchaeota archaeon]|nr:MAG: AsnC family transcriptional regulator [Candidatus Geothermarchaeota archaeon]